MHRDFMAYDRTTLTSQGALASTKERETPDTPQVDFRWMNEVARN